MAPQRFGDFFDEAAVPAARPTYYAGAAAMDAAAPPAFDASHSWDPFSDELWEKYTSAFPERSFLETAQNSARPSSFGRSQNSARPDSTAQCRNDDDEDDEKCHESRFSFDSVTSCRTRTSSSSSRASFSSCWEAELACDPVWIDDARTRIRHAALAVVETQQVVNAANWKPTRTGADSPNPRQPASSSVETPKAPKSPVSPKRSMWVKGSSKNSSASSQGASTTDSLKAVDVPKAKGRKGLMKGLLGSWK